MQRLVTLIAATICLMPASVFADPIAGLWRHGEKPAWIKIEFNDGVGAGVHILDLVSGQATGLSARVAREFRFAAVDAQGESVPCFVFGRVEVEVDVEPPAEVAVARCHSARARHAC